MIKLFTFYRTHFQVSNKFTTFFFILNYSDTRICSSCNGGAHLIFHIFSWPHINDSVYLFSNEFLDITTDKSNRQQGSGINWKGSFHLDYIFILFLNPVSNGV